LQKWQKNKRGMHAGREAHYGLRGTMKRYFWIGARLFLRQARWGFAVIGAWFLLGTLIFGQPADCAITRPFCTRFI